MCLLGLSMSFVAGQADFSLQKGDLVRARQGQRFLWKKGLAGTVLQREPVMSSETPAARNHQSFYFKHLSPLLGGIIP